MRKKVAILNCGAPDQPRFTSEKLSASQIIASKLASLGSIEPIIFTPTANHLPSPVEFDGFVIPGSKYDPDPYEIIANPWMEGLLEFIRQVHKLNKPLLGICFGHQAIGVAFGSVLHRVEPPRNMELGLVPVELTELGQKDLLFDGVPKNFLGMQYHFRYIDHLPAEMQSLANGSDLKLVQAIRIGSLYGVQFHPEYSSAHMAELVDAYADRLATKTDLSVVRIRGPRSDEKVLANFVKIVLS